ncbi:MAG TPA: methyltransferase domain-containing protein [Candidatus Omnitrophota bacterium]|nr:methyltransferase domain-containing protein [Candidatus Omnitrophota bacterium]
MKKESTFSRKLILQSIYRAWYERIFKYCIKPGKTLEIGSGFAFSKKIFPACITSEILPSPWVDIVCDAQKLPVKNNSLSNIIAIDVLHHIADIDLFFKECARALAPQGKIIITDMYVSALSSGILRWGHFEDFASIAKATRLFFKKTGVPVWQKDFTLTSKEMHDCLAYPLSGGFNYPSVLPGKMLTRILQLEDKLGFLRPIMAFKSTVVLEKKGT